MGQSPSSEIKGLIARALDYVPFELWKIMSIIRTALNSNPDDDVAKYEEY